MLPLFQTFKTMKDCDGSDGAPSPEIEDIIAWKKRFVHCFFRKYQEKFAYLQKFTAVSRKTKTTENLQEIRNKNAGKTG